MPKAETKVIFGTPTPAQRAAMGLALDETPTVEAAPPEDTRAINTYDQFAQAGGGIGIFRDSFVWLVHRYEVGKDGKLVSVPTDPNASWYHNGSKAFHDGHFMGEGPERRTRHEAKPLSLQAAQAWVAKTYGEVGPWSTNRLGDVIPTRIHTAYPLRPRPRKTAAR